MSRIVAFTFMIIVGVLTFGCSKTPKSQAMNEDASVLNVAAAPKPSPTPPAPEPATPVSDTQPVTFAAAAPTAPAPNVGVSSKNYTVRKGDTLFSIAKSQYGSGRDWQKIISANPGLDPQKLRVGQQITIP
jgi:nucleoid-associated protein YgaU